MLSNYFPWDNIIRENESIKRFNYAAYRLFLYDWKATRDYSSSSRVTTCSVTSFANLQDIAIILSGIERNSHIICGFLSVSYPWDNNFPKYINP